MPDRRFDISPFYPLLTFPQRENKDFQKFEKQMRQQDKEEFSLTRGLTQPLAASRAADMKLDLMVTNLSKKTVSVPRRITAYGDHRAKQQRAVSEFPPHSRTVAVENVDTAEP